MHRTDHRGKGNYKKNHDGLDRLTPQERMQFNGARSKYWKNEYKN